jgi:hypothetical protein
MRSQRGRALKGVALNIVRGTIELLGTRREVLCLGVSAVYFPRPQFATKKLIEGQPV